MTKSQRVAEILDILERKLGRRETELIHADAFQLLIATVLSAQCTDKRVNMVTPRLFADYPDAEALSFATPEVVFEYIKSVSYPNAKAGYLVGIAQMLMRDFGGQVPASPEDLVRLPGVGRKTANVVQAFAFGKQTLAVDTHVFRVSHRLGLVSQRCTTPLSVEKALLRLIPEGLVADAHTLLLLHGRYTCTARKAKCEACSLTSLCTHYKQKHNQYNKQQL